MYKRQAYLKTIETGSITHAASQLGYTQSAISRMIADLEDSWGVTPVSYTHLDVYKRQTLAVAGMSLIGTLAGTFGGILVANKPVSYTHLSPWRWPSCSPSCWAF